MIKVIRYFLTYTTIYSAKLGLLVAGFFLFMDSFFYSLVAANVFVVIFFSVKCTQHSLAVDAIIKMIEESSNERVQK